MTQCEQVLSMFRNNPGGVTTAEWITTPPLGAEYRARISELRRAGYRITCERIRKGCFLYKLVEGQ